MKSVPKFLLKAGIKSDIKKMWKGNSRWTDTDVQVNAVYAATSYERFSIVDVVELRT